MALKKKGEQKVLEVNAEMQGELTFKDPVNLIINGNFQGKLNVRGMLSIGERATVNADILGEDILIAGRVEGKITAEKRVRLVPPADVKGEIRTHLLVVEEGAVLNGSCVMGERKSNYLSLDEMAGYLQIDKDTLLKWAEERKVPSIREGGNYYFDRAEVENWLSREKVA
ncbi:MAG: polymer-forming cytoskeletal protein [Candidatus Omnitrophica bacterium]|nr:polymer-forming cytoskeletal protein [Candidatus Omnitrophota bacterium]